jgi:3-oxoacyl-[acyl-carrier protein] reductase
MDMELKDKIGVVTGGSLGIGLAVAEALAKEGVHLALVARDAERVARVAAEIATKYGVKVIAIGADVSKAEDVAVILAEVEKTFGGVDFLINNAGTGSNERVMDASDEKWQYYWDLHVMAAVRLSRGLVPLMQKRGGGVILNNASICAKQPSFYEPIYNTTKAALMMFSKVLSNELIKFNIRVNCINAGLILTPDWWKTAGLLTEGTDQTPAAYLDQVAKDLAPIGRFASPEELADFFVFMCSPRSSYCVGSSYYVDGGWLNVVA